MSEIISVPITNVESLKVKTCPICNGAEYHPKLYDQLCYNCRRKLLWVQK